MNQPIDPARLTELLSAAADTVPAGGDMLDGIKKGVDRRRKVRQSLAVVGSSAAVIVAIIVGASLHSAKSSIILPAVSPSPTHSPSSGPSASPVVSTTGLPPGLQALAVTATGNHWWVLAASLLEGSTDAGGTFSKLALPSDWASSSLNAGYGIAFLSANHGVLWQGTHIWVSEDGGSNWTSGVTVAGDSVIGHATTPSAIYLLVQRCGSAATATTQCSTILRTYDGSRVTFTDHDVVLPMNEIARSITAFGGALWVSATDGGGAGGYILASTDGGAHFTSTKSSQGCLATTIVASSGTGMWQVCATGMQAQLFRSNDSGATFGAVRTPSGIGNCAQIVATSANGSVLTPCQGLYWSDDNFVTSHQVASPAPDLANSTYLVGSGVSETVFAIESTNSGVQLWVSTDAGHTWRRV